VWLFIKIKLNLELFAKQGIGFMKVSMAHGYVEAVQHKYRIKCGPLVEEQSSGRLRSGDCAKRIPAELHLYSGDKHSCSYDANLKSPSNIYLRTKKLIDIIASLFVIFPFLIICILIYVANITWSPGPLFFRQSRIGYRGKPFMLIKFRTMLSSEECARNLLTADCDPRITKVGKFLRKTRIDELPQLLNVLRGEMSWVGPRPEATELSKHYQQVVPYYQSRHIILPGITGWAQVNQGHVTQIDDVHKKLDYDLFFIRNYSIWLEILIAIRTVKIVFSGYGAK